MVPGANTDLEPLTVDELLSWVRGEFQICAEPAVPQRLQVDVSEKPHPLDCGMPEPQKSPLTACLSMKTPFPTLGAAQADGTGAPLPHVFVVNPENASCIEEAE
jgi:hypothetical protein